MAWSVYKTLTFKRGYAKLASVAQSRCDTVIEELSNSDDPLQLGERLVGRSVCKYRFGNYRLIYGVDYQITLLELYDVGKRGRIYD